jgi:hypothetical protein
VLIDCDSCMMRATAACDDCIVTYLLDRSDGAVVFDADEERALRNLAAAGLAPANRFTPVRERDDHAVCQEVIPLAPARAAHSASGDDEEPSEVSPVRRVRGRKLA